MTTIEVRRRLPASPHRVWQAFTDPAQFVAWFWPPRLEAIGDLDVRVGGLWRIASEVAGMGVSGEFERVDEPVRLAFTWRWDGDSARTLVTVGLSEDPAGGTALTVLHGDFATDDGAADHVQGWNDCLDRLESALRPDGDYLQTFV